MSFFKTSTNKEDVKQGGSSYVSKSGMYEIHLIAPFANVSKNGSTTVDLFLEYEGQKQVMYGNLRITNNDGSPNKIGSKVFNQLAIIADMENVSDPIDAELPIGKGGKLEDCSVLEDLADIDVLMRVQMEYSVFQSNIQEKKVIKAFFRASDKASAEEIVNESEPGLQYEKEEKYFDNITFKDGLTQEDIDQWIKDGRPKGTGSSSSGSSAPKEKPSFGKKKGFGK